jgi:hypothetical protein
LDSSITELATNQTLGIEDGVFRVHGSLRLGSVADKTLGFREGNVGRSCTITLIVCDDFDTIILPHAQVTPRNHPSIVWNLKLRRIQLWRDG